MSEMKVYQKISILPEIRWIFKTFIESNNGFHGYKSGERFWVLGGSCLRKGNLTKQKKKTIKNKRIENKQDGVENVKH